MLPQKFYFLQKFYNLNLCNYKKDCNKLLQSFLKKLY